MLSISCEPTWVREQKTKYKSNGKGNQMKPPHGDSASSENAFFSVADRTKCGFDTLEVRCQHDNRETARATTRGVGPESTRKIGVSNTWPSSCDGGRGRIGPKVQLILSCGPTDSGGSGQKRRTTRLAWSQSWSGRLAVKIAETLRNDDDSAHTKAHEGGVSDQDRNRHCQ